MAGFFGVKSPKQLQSVMPAAIEYKTTISGLFDINSLEDLTVKRYTNGEYRGQFDQLGKRCGWGSMLYDNSVRIYEGQWKNDERNQVERKNK